TEFFPTLHVLRERHGELADGAFAGEHGATPELGRGCPCHNRTADPTQARKRKERGPGPKTWASSLTGGRPHVTRPADTRHMGTPLPRTRVRPGGRPRRTGGGR